MPAYIDRSTEARLSSLFPKDWVDGLYKYLGLDPTVAEADQPIDVLDLLEEVVGITESIQWRNILRKQVVLSLPLHAIYNCNTSGTGSKIFLPYGTISSITSFTWVDVNGDSNSLTSGTDYTPTFNSDPPFLWKDYWTNVITDPSDTRPEPLTITYTAGYSTFQQIPRATLQAIKILCFHLMEIRGQTAEGDKDTAYPRAFVENAHKDRCWDERALEFI